MTPSKKSALVVLAATAILIVLVISSMPEPGLEIHAGAWTDGEWPFTTESVELSCTGDAVFAEANGLKYAVNGVAKSRAAQHGAIPNLRPIWKSDSVHPELRVNIGPMIEYGLTLCGR